MQHEATLETPHRNSFGLAFSVVTMIVAMASFPSECEQVDGQPPSAGYVRLLCDQTSFNFTLHAYSTFESAVTIII